MIGILGPYSPFLVGGSGLSFRGGGQNCFRGEGPFATLQGRAVPPWPPPMPMYGQDEASNEY